jgi:hypothetical protein
MQAGLLTIACRSADLVAGQPHSARQHQVYSMRHIQNNEEVLKKLVLRSLPWHSGLVIADNHMLMVSRAMQCSQGMHLAVRCTLCRLGVVYGKQPAAIPPRTAHQGDGAACVLCSSPGLNTDRAALQQTHGQQSMRQPWQVLEPCLPPHASGLGL